MHRSGDRRLTNRGICFLAFLALHGAMTAAVAQDPVPADSDPGREPIAAQTPANDAGGERWIGVLMTEALDGGVRLVAVVPSGPAARAGLRAGDVVVEFDGRPVADRRSIRQRIVTTDGVVHEVVFVRDGEMRRARLRPESRKPSVWGSARRAPRASGARRFEGVRVVELTPELRAHYGAPEDRGVLVVSLGREGSAEATGPLAVGDLILEACERPLRRPSEWLACRAGAVSEGRVSVLRMRAGRRETVVLPASPPAGAVVGTIFENWVSDEALRERRRAELAREIEALRARLAELEAAQAALANEDR